MMRIIIIMNYSIVLIHKPSGLQKKNQKKKKRKDFEQLNQRKNIDELHPATQNLKTISNLRNQKNSLTLNWKMISLMSYLKENTSMSFIL